MWIPISMSIYTEERCREYDKTNREKPTNITLIPIQLHPLTFAHEF